MVKVKDVTYSYSKSTHPILDHISFEIENGQCLGILGNNGAGKSTLLKCLDGILHTYGTSILVDQDELLHMTSRKKAQTIAYVQQTSIPLEMTVYDTVLLGRKPYITWDASARDHEIVREVLTQMNLESYALRMMSRLSGGEVQKVLLAKAIVQEPRLLLLDEPTSNLDPYNQHEGLKLVRKITYEKRICVAVVLHDLNLAVRYCDRFLFLKDSKVYSFGGIETVSAKMIHEVYGMKANVIDYDQRKIVIPA